MMADGEVEGVVDLEAGEGDGEVASGVGEGEVAGGLEGTGERRTVLAIICGVKGKALGLHCGSKIMMERQHKIRRSVACIIPVKQARKSSRTRSTKSNKYGSSYPVKSKLRPKESWKW